MIAGTARDALAECSTWPSPSGRRWCRSSTGWRPRPRTPARSRTATPAWSGRRSTPPSSASTRAHRAHRRQRRRRARRGAGAARPRPRRAGPRRAAADVPDARRPQRHAVGAPDGRAADVEPAGQRGRLDGAARRRPRRPGRLAVRRSGPGRRTCPACRRRSSTSGRRTPSATRTSTTPSRIWQAGGVAELHVWPGGFHGFDGIVPHAAHLEGRRRRPRGLAPPAAHPLTWRTLCDASRSTAAGRPGRTPTSSPRWSAPRRPGRRSPCRTTPRSAATATPPPTAPGPATSPAACTSTGRRCTRPEEYRDKRVLLEFEGVYRTAMVYVNGALAGHWATGYTGFTVDLDDHLLLRRRQRDPRRLPRPRGLPLVLRRRHPPAGAPRRRRAHAHRPGRRPRHDARTSTTSSPSSRWRRRSSTTAAGWPRSTSSPRSGTATARVVATATSPVTVLPGEPAVVRQRVLLPEPALWSPDSPSLYSAAVSLRNGDTEVDDDDGVLRRPHPVAGPRSAGCGSTASRSSCAARASTHDNGVLGAATIGRAEERRVQLLKAGRASTRCAARTTR